MKGKERKEGNEAKGTKRRDQICKKKKKIEAGKIKTKRGSETNQRKEGNEGKEGRIAEGRKR